MKKIILTLLFAACAFGAQAEGDWRTTLGKVTDLLGDTGIAGFARKEAPAYITGNFAEKDRVAANDIAGKDQACEQSFRSAVYLACNILKNRREYDELNADPLK